MEINEQLHRQIEDYLARTLSEAENQAFQKRINADANLAEMVEAYRLGNELAMGQDLLDFQAEMQAFQTDYRPSNKNLPKKGARGKNYLLGLIGALLVGATAYFFIDLSEKEEVGFNEKSRKGKIEIKAPLNQGSVDEKNNDIEKRNAQSSVKMESRKNEKSLSAKPEVEIISENEFSNQKKEIKLIPPKTTTSLSAEEKFSIPEKIAKKAPPENTLDISRAVTVEATCMGKREGSIAIDPQRIKAGLPPYALSVNFSDFQAGLAWEGLPAGKHKIVVKDANNQIQSLEITLPEKECKTENNFAFNPSLGETFTFPLEKNLSGKVEIFSSSGETVWSRAFAKGKNLQWNGRNTNGGAQLQGNFTFRIQYENRKTTTGEVTVIR